MTAAGRCDGLYSSALRGDGHVGRQHEPERKVETPRFHIRAGLGAAHRPFALKLLAWLKLAGVPFEQVVEANPRKGPKGKNPWIELDGQRIGDSEVIIELLKRRYGIDLDEGLTPEQMALGHSWRRTFEEHFHQVLEWELFFHPAGAAWMRDSMGSQMPSVLAGPVFLLIRQQFGKQLYARSIARHSPEVIAQKGRADLDALAAFLGE